MVCQSMRGWLPAQLARHLHDRGEVPMMQALRHILPLLLVSVASVHPGEHHGRQLYLRYCAACHGRQGRGDGPVAPALGEKPTDLTQLAATHGEEFPLQAVIDAIDGTRTVRAHGVSEMPVWGEVFKPYRASPKEKLAARSKIIAIADYLRSLQGAPLPSH
jgi:mono/diheme cytochrome c family protein